MLACKTPTQNTDPNLILCFLIHYWTDEGRFSGPSMLSVQYRFILGLFSGKSTLMLLFIYFIYYENRTQNTSKKKTNTDRRKDTKIQTHT